MTCTVEMTEAEVYSAINRAAAAKANVIHGRYDCATSISYAISLSTTDKAAVVEKVNMHTIKVTLTPSSPADEEPADEELPTPDSRTVEPRPPSPEFIDAMAANGARPELIAALRGERPKSRRPRLDWEQKFALCCLLFVVSAVTLFVLDAVVP